MRELSTTQQATLLELLVDGRMECALVTLIDWAGQQTVDNNGNESIALNGWDLSHRTGPPSSLEAENLDDIDEESAEAWRNAGAVHVITCLERRIIDEWPAQQPVARWLSADGVEYWILPKHPPPPTRFDRIVGTSRWLTLLRVVPCVNGPHRIVLHGAQASTNDRLVNRAGMHSGMIGHFDDGVQVAWVPQLAGFVAAVGLSDDETRFSSAVALLSAAYDCTFFVLPECTMPTPLRHRLASAMPVGAASPCLSVFGSFHDCMTSCNPPFQNRAELRDHRGSVLFTVVKSARASAPDTTVGGGQVDEYISVGNELHALVTSIGIVGVSICLDFSHPNGRCYASWTSMAPEWMLVPSMGGTSTVDLHRGVAGQLADTHRTVSLVANQLPIGSGVVGFIRDRGRSAKGDAGDHEQERNVTNLVLPLST